MRRDDCEACGLDRGYDAADRADYLDSLDPGRPRTRAEAERDEAGY
jgi:hypothetical protein